MNDRIDVEGILRVADAWKVQFLDERTGEVKRVPQRRHPRLFGAKTAAEVRFLGDQTRIRISGSPASFLSGQNAVGPNNVQKLSVRCFDAVCEELEIDPTVAERNSWVRGNTTVYGADLSGYLVFETPETRDTVLRQLSRSLGGMSMGSVSRRGWRYVAYKLPDGTLVRFYAKDRKLSERGRMLANADGGRLMRLLRRSIRVEVGLSSRRLKRLGLATGAAWKRISTAKLIRSILGKLPINQSVLKHYPKNSSAREGSVERLIERWTHGEDVLDGCSRATRTRRIKVGREHGIDFHSTYSTARVGRIVARNMRRVRLLTKVPKWVRRAPILDRLMGRVG